MIRKNDYCHVPPNHFGTLSRRCLNAGPALSQRQVSVPLLNRMLSDPGQGGSYIAPCERLIDFL